MPDRGTDMPELADEIARARPRWGLESDRLKARIGEKLGIPAQPLRLGRFVVLDRVGSGGLGFVYSALDPDLQRKVAVKVLRGSERASAQQRLVREARAMAALSHPNVVDVYDVGTVEGRVFIAMEFVEGVNLRQWLADDERSWREVIDVFVQAGRGLAAAHAAGLVHRDFKPDNVLVGLGDPARVRVADFGLARALRSGHAPGATTGQDRDDGGPLMGTPAYMAPEQIRGGAADDKSDQFSYCVALFEALYRARPFEAENAGLLGAIERAEIRRRPAQSSVPKRIDAALRRGLAARPADRWPDLAILIAALTRARAPRRLLVAGTLIGATAVVGAALWVDARPPDICAQPQAALSDAWTPARREQLRQAFEDVAPHTGSAAWARTQSQVEGFVGAWRATLGQVCTLPMAQRDRGMTCLRNAVSQLRIRLDLFASPTRNVVTNAPRSVAGLPTPGSCEHRASDDSADLPTPNDPGLRERVRELRLERVRAEVLASLGESRQARDVANRVLEQAQRIDYAPATAECMRLAGWLRAVHGELAEGEEMLTNAFDLALHCRNDIAAADAASDLLVVVGIYGQRREDAMRWFRHAEAVVARVGEQSLSGDRFHHNAGIFFTTWDENQRAEDHLQIVLERRMNAHGPDHPATASVLLNLGSVAVGLYGDDVALDYYERAATSFERIAGADAPDYARALANIALVVDSASPRRLEASERAVEIFETSYGPDSPLLNEPLNNLGLVYLDRGRLLRAHEMLHRSLQIKQRALGPDHPDTALGWSNAGLVLAHMGQFGEAVRYLERAVATLEGGPGRAHPHWRRVHVNFARSLVAAGDPLRARTHFELADERGFSGGGSEPR